MPPVKGLLREISNNTVPGSFANQLRQKRFVLFVKLLQQVPSPIRILDVGGTRVFWENMGVDYLLQEKEISVVTLNLFQQTDTRADITSIVGDARDLSQFSTGEFDVVFSNSVIEHVGSFEDQQRMAQEVRRVGKRYFVQTPARSFPIEPHFIFPWFQYLPELAKLYLVTHYNLGWYPRIPDLKEARAFLKKFRLLTEQEMRKLFPESLITKELFLGMTKSYIAYRF